MPGSPRRVISDLGARSCEVRFTPMSRPRQLNRFRPKSAIGGIAVELLHSPCVAQFPTADTVCQLHENCRLTAFGLRHIAIAYPCVGALRCYGLAGTPWRPVKAAGAR